MKISIGSRTATCTAMTEHVRVVVVVEVNAVHVAVRVLPVGLTVHENLHRLAALLDPCHEEHAADWNPDHEALRAGRPCSVEEALRELLNTHGLEAILGAEV